MAYTLKNANWAGASGTESYPIMQCVMVSEDATGTDPDNEVVEIKTTGEYPLLPYAAAGTERAINLGQSWRGDTLATFQTGFTSAGLVLSGWEVASGDRYVGYDYQGGVSIFVASNQISAPEGSTSYHGTFMEDAGGIGGLGWNASGNVHIISFQAARLTGTTAIPFDSSKASMGITFSRHDWTGDDSNIWAAIGDGEITAPGAFEATATLAGWAPGPVVRIGGQTGNSACPGQHFIHVSFNAQLNAEDFKVLHNRFLTELISGAAPPAGTSAPGLRSNPRIILP